MDMLNILSSYTGRRIRGESQYRWTKKVLDPKVAEYVFTLIKSSKNDLL